MAWFPKKWMIVAVCMWAAACGSHPKDKKRLAHARAGAASGDEGTADPASGRNSDSGEATSRGDGSRHEDIAQNDPRLRGSWVTDCIAPEEDSAHHTKLEHRFFDGTVQSIASLYAGSCEPPNLEIRFTLKSQVVAGEKSALGQDVRLIDYTLSKASMSLHSEGELLQSNLQNGGRGRCLVPWEHGKEVEISALTDEQRSHCGGKVQAPKEGTAFFDIYQIKGDELRFGTAVDSRPANGEGESSGHRPRELADYVYRKVVD